MMRPFVIAVSLVLAMSCSEEPIQPPIQPPVQPPIQPMSGAVMPHGDHSPRYGGTVWMHGDLHFEVVLNRSGEHGIYLSDASRVELPAAVATDVRIVISRPAEEPETLELELDEFGESWIAHGSAVEDPETRALVSFTYEGEPYEIDLPFVAEPADPNAPDPHAVP